MPSAWHSCLHLLHLRVPPIGSFLACMRASPHASRFVLRSDVTSTDFEDRELFDLTSGPRQGEHDLPLQRGGDDVATSNVFVHVWVSEGQVEPTRAHCRSWRSAV